MSAKLQVFEQVPLSRLRLAQRSEGRWAHMMVRQLGSPSAGRWDQALQQQLALPSAGLWEHVRGQLLGEVEPSAPASR